METFGAIPSKLGTILLDITAKCVIDMPVASDQGRYEVPFRVLLW